MPTSLGAVRSQAIRWPAHVIVADSALGAAITKFRDPVPATGPRSTTNPSGGFDESLENLSALELEHPELSSAAINSAVAMPARRLPSENGVAFKDVPAVRYVRVCEFTTLPPRKGCRPEMTSVKTAPVRSQPL